MAAFKALCLVGVASLVATTAAQSADLLPPPPPVEAPLYAPQPAAFGGGWYLRGDVGAGIEQISSPSSTFQNTGGFLSATGGYPGGFAYGDDSIGTQAIIGLGAGYQFNSYFRADVTGEYRTDTKLHAIESYNISGGCAIGTCYDGYNGTVQKEVFLINGYVDIGTWYGVTPYIGGGVGTSINTFSNLTDTSYSTSGSGRASNRTTAQFAYAAMAGFAYNLTPNLKLDFGYRYLDEGSLKANAIACSAQPCFYETQKYHLTSNDIRLGLRYQFADFVPYTRPVIARY